MINNFEDLTFQILNIDKITHKKGVYDVEMRPYAALSYRVVGEGRFDVMGRKINTAPGDVLFIPSDVSYHVEYTASESIVVHLSGCNYKIPENVEVLNRSEMGAKFRRLLDIWREGHSVNRAKSCVYDILDSISEDRSLAACDTPFATCLAYIDENYCDPALTMIEVCRHGYISASALRRAFNDNLGVSPKQYLVKKRMCRALELLSEGRLSVKDIATASGFSDDKYFSRAFKARYGHPPSAVHGKLSL